MALGEFRVKDLVKNIVVIRTPRLDDLDHLLKIENRCFLAHRFKKKDFEYHFRNPSSIFALAEGAGLIIGYVAGIVYHGPKHAVGKIYSMAVLSEWRKLGVGSALLNYFEREAMKRGSESATLEVRKTNRAAIGLYRRFGYHVERTLPDYYASGSDGLKMRKLLEAGRN